MVNELSANSLTDEMQVEVFGTDLNGRQFIEQVRTRTITRGGATIPLVNKLAPDSELIVRNTVTNEETAARVVDFVQDATFAQVYGIAFIDPSVNLWEVELPEARAQQTDRRVTERRVSEREVTAQQQAISRIEKPTPRALQERRRERRTAMKAAACIRCYDREVVVECEDVSRGGFRFKSRKAYPAGTRIEAAVPYEEGSVNIFVTAQIAYQQDLSGGVYRHGVAYVKSTSARLPEQIGTARQCPYCGKLLLRNLPECPHCRETLPEVVRKAQVAPVAKRGQIRRGLLYMLLAAVIHYFAGGYGALDLPFPINPVVTVYLSPLLFLGGLGLTLYGFYLSRRA